jgi:hypothetical protein
MGPRRGLAVFVNELQERERLSDSAGRLRLRRRAYDGKTYDGKSGAKQKTRAGNANASARHC